MSPKVPNRSWVVASALLVGFGMSAIRASAAPSASLSLEPNPAITVGPGATGSFDVFLRDYAPDDPTHPISSFGLDVGASDPALTGGGTDFSGFGFTLDPGLSGILGGLPLGDFDITDDGRVSFLADLPPLGQETGILESLGDVQLGTLLVEAPTTPGLYDVAFAVDPDDPFATNLLVGPPPFPLLTLPGDGELTVTNSALDVVPEPSSLALWGLGLVGVVAWQYRRRKARKG